MIKTQPLKYHGGKSYLASWIHSLAPPSCFDDPENGYTHRNIAFAGGLGEFWNWLPIEGISEAVNDLNSELTTFYHVIRNELFFPTFVEQVRLTPFSEIEFRLAQDEENRFNNSPSFKAARFFIRYRQSRQGLGKDYATPTTRTRRGMNENVSAWLSSVDGLPECHERLRRVEIRNMDAIKFIEAYDHPRALFYLDPPYLHETRVTTGEYTHEMTATQHADLLCCLSHITGKFMLSGYPSELYNQWCKDQDWCRYSRRIDNKASSKKSKDKKIECVWTNY